MWFDKEAFTEVAFSGFGFARMFRPSLGRVVMILVALATLPVALVMAFLFAVRV